MSKNANTVSFVRDTMLPEADPPLTEIGAIKWVRENLFSGILNSFLTLVSIFVVVWIVNSIMPWLWYSVWDAGSLTECRELAKERFGDVPSACFAVITDRWQQLLFGFYPADLYFRPLLAFILLFVALAPALFTSLPRKMLLFTAVYPFLMYWLLWGGSIWGPVMVLLGFYLAVVLLEILPRYVGSLTATIICILTPIIWGMKVSPDVANLMQANLPISIEAVRSQDFGGFMLSVVIGITGIALSLPIGILLALGRKSDLLIVKSICVGFIEFIRGVPLITLLITASLLLNYFLPKGTNFDLILRVIIMVTLFASAYMAETIRGGLAALPRGQYEAADALGLDYWQAQQLIIMPQALKYSIPGIVGNFIGLFKDTTLVVFIGLLDPIGLVGSIRASTDWNGVYWELFIFVGLLFFVCCFSMSRYSQYLERKLQTDHR